MARAGRFGTGRGRRPAVAVGCFFTAGREGAGGGAGGGEHTAVLGVEHTGVDLDPRVAASELSLDAPIDRGDRDSSSFGERFAGAEAEQIEVQVVAGERIGDRSPGLCGRVGELLRERLLLGERYLVVVASEPGAPGDLRRPREHRRLAEVAIVR